ncbi:MAG: alpha/beta fold hydrolase [Proteobacteria bacterium]|nr:alpha/beta fold hydrolase [Pseudomonadota bacterium]MBU1740505.1 alpha/beta fold hydrolase [Pseudomonadota bacterium]
MTDFNPPWWLQNPKLQSVLSSLPWRTPRRNPMLDAARPLILEVDGRVRLMGFHSPQQGRPAKGLVIMLHGWEGSVDSTYLLSTGRTLYEAGYDVFRLNLRDHGDTHHLNQGVFRASKLAEVHQGVARAAELARGGPVFLVGFSLGGNFVLRIIRRATQKVIPGLRQAAAISPLLDPAKSTAAIDSIGLFRRYFMKKWKRSLEKKQALFPERYDFGPVLAQKSIWAMSEVIIDQFGQFDSLRHYFRTYTLRAEDLGGLDWPLLIITAQDDPIIPFGDFQGLDGSGRIRLIAPAHGGHAGFIDGFPWRPWYESQLVAAFDARR